MKQTAQGAKPRFPEVKFGRPDGGETRIAELSGPRFRDLEAGFFDEIAESLRVPGVEVVVRFIPVEAAIPGFTLQRHKEKQFAGGRKQAMDFAEDGRWIEHMLESMMADHGVD